MRVTRYIRQHHIGLIALFVALTGTAYAGTQVAGHQGNPKGVAAKKKKKPKSIPGPAGPQGPKGDTGAAGSARAYALVQDGALVADRSVGIQGMSLGCPTSGACSPPAPGTGNIHAYCFNLAFTPNNVQITPLGISSTGGGAGAREVVNWDAQAPAISNGASVTGCPAGYLSAQVSASGTNDTLTPYGFYVAFN